MEINKNAKEFQLFFYSQQFSDGLRITLSVLIPTLLFSYFGYFELGITFSIGAVCVSIADLPGPIIHRKNGMLISITCVFLVALITLLARSNFLIMALEVLLLSFFFSMFNIYGTRAATVGSAAILVMVLSMDKPIEPEHILRYALLILFGGLWYFLISLATYTARPYRIAQRALGECIRELAYFLTIKANFYNCNTNLDDDYRKLVAQQLAVSEKQDMVRELLFKTRVILNESTPTSRKLVMAFIESVDLFEDITATYYDYAAIRKQYGNTAVLNHTYQLIYKLADELNRMGVAIYANVAYRTTLNFEEELIKLKTEIDLYGKDDPQTSNLVLKKILVNFRRMTQRFNDLMRYFETDIDVSHKFSTNDYRRFVGHQSLDPKIFWNNLTFNSSVFRFSLRVSIACIIGYFIAKSLSNTHHSYWIIMTIAFMLKPAFSLTKQRNYERIAGTITGGIIGALILALIPIVPVQFAIMVVLMIGFYSLQRVKYLASVIFMTPFIIILFKFMGLPFLSVVQERILDTVIGCFIAIIASYVLFPNWERENFNNYLFNMLKANGAYLQKLALLLLGHEVSSTDYKLARKDVYVSSANLSGAFQRMLSEPKSKQKDQRYVHQFVVLNHILFSNIATIASTVIMQNKRRYPEEIIKSAKKALQALCESLFKFDPDCNLPAIDKKEQDHVTENNTLLSADEALLKEQLDYIYRISKDIKRVTDAITDVKTTPQPVHNLLGLSQ